jgi:hypothetical protein
MAASIAITSSALTVTTPTDRDIVMTRVFDAPRRLVFEAWNALYGNHRAGLASDLL